MLNPIEELKKYHKINLEDNQIKHPIFPDIIAQNNQFITEVNKLSKNQFKAVQKIETLYDDIIELLQEKMDKWDTMEKTLSDKENIIDSLKTGINEKNIEKTNIILKLIEIIDTFDTVAIFISNSNDISWIAQINRVMDNIKALMSEAGIEEIDMSINIFDDKFHEAVGVTYDENKAFRELVRIEQKGYTYKGNLLRKAKVIVNNARKEDQYE